LMAKKGSESFFLRRYNPGSNREKGL